MSTASDHSIATSCNDEPVVGGIFNGSIITKVDVEVTERERTLKKRFLLTLEGGLMAIDDRYVPKSSVIEFDTTDNDGSCSSFHSFTFEGMELPDSAKGFTALKEQKELEREERRQRRTEKQKRRESLKQGKYEKGDSTKGTTKNGTIPGKSTSDETIVVDNTASNHTAAKKRVAVVSKITKVVPETDPVSSDGGPRATWMFPSAQEVPSEASLWAPVDVCLLPIGKKEIDDQNSDHSSHELTGLWGYAPRSGSKHEKPPTSSSSMKSSSTHSSRPSSFKATKDVWVYPPNMKLPPDLPVHGTYKFAPLKNGKKKTKFKWPPPIDPEKRQQRRVNRLKELPKLFSNSPAMPMSIQAFSAKNEPFASSNIENDANKGKSPILNGQKLSDTGLVGVWAYLDGQEERDDEWVVQDVRLFPPGQTPSSNDEGDNDLPQGTWVIYENEAIASKDDTVMQPHNPHNQWIDSKQQPKVHLFAPGQKPDIKKEPVIATGTWTYAKDSIKRKWPPPTKEEVKKLRKVGKVNIPKIFQQKTSRPLTVYSKDSPENPKGGNKNGKIRPRPTDKGAIQALPQQASEDAPVTGQWAFFDVANEDPNGEWQPVNVVIYAPDEAPPSKSDIQGIWTIHDADPDHVCVHSPGFELDPADDSILASGVWTFHSGDEDSTTDDVWLTSWPPPKNIDQDAIMQGPIKWTPPGKAAEENWKSHEIRVVLQGCVPAKQADDGQVPVTGIWKFNDAQPENFDEWLPQELVIYPKGHEPPNNEIEGPSGLWGIHTGSEPNEEGVWNAQEVWIFQPGEEDIPADCEIQGVWTYPSRQKDAHWPPIKNEAKKETKQPEIENLPEWDPNGHGDDWKPQKVSVVPKSSVSGPTEGSPKGIWVFADGQEPDNLEEWNGLEVAVYPKGVEPDCSDGRPTGVWGFYKDAIPEVDGDWSANAVVFCAPGVEPSDDIVVQGQWAFFEDDTEWPLACEPFEAKELKPEDVKSEKPPKPPKPPKMVAKKPEIIPKKTLLSPVDRAKLRVLPVKSPEKNPFAEDERHIAVLGKYQSAFEVANRPKKPQSRSSLIKKKYKK
jgi:hypothetical protein